MSIVNEFDPHNDLIDKYLKGELKGEALQLFEEELKQNAELNTTLQERRVVYEAIVHYGGAELKNFIRRQTTHRRILGLSKTNIYYAAAAIALLMLGSVVIFINLQKTARLGKFDVATDDKTEKAKENNRNTEGKTGKDGMAITNDTASLAKHENNVMLNDADSNAMLIAANVTVVSIDLPAVAEETQETATMEKARGEAPAIRSKSLGRMDGKKAVEIDTDSVSLSEPETFNRLQSSIRMNMNFYNTASGEKWLIYKNGTSGEPELFLYNLPFDNPLLFVDGNYTYLKAGNEYYPIQLIQGQIQNLKPITDSKLIKRFNR